MMIRKVIISFLMLLFLGGTISPVIGINLEKQSTMQTLDGNTLHLGFDKNNEGDLWAFLVDSKGALFPNMVDVFCLNGWQSDHIRTLEGEEATKENLNNNFEWLDSMEDLEDTVLFYFHGHGGVGQFALYNGLMTYSELGEKLDELESECIAVIIDTCYSGSAIEYLSKNGRVVITSANASETSGSCRLTDPLLEGFEELADYIFEGNDDDFVSAEEAFCYAVNTEFWKYRPYSTHGQTPQIEDRYDGELQITNISHRGDQLDQYQSRNSNSINTLWCINDKTWLAQSFKPGVECITRVKLLLSIGYGDPGDMVVSIRKSLEGDDLVALTISQDNFKIWNRLIDIDFEDISVNPWDTYYIVCRAPNGDRDNRYEWLTCEETYSRGSGHITMDEGTSWEILGHDQLNSRFYSDFCFYVFGKNETQKRPPTTPSITAGPKYGIISDEFTYRATFTGEGPVYYNFSWADGTYSGWMGPYNPGESCEAKHEYNIPGFFGIPGTYRIRVMVKDSFDLESDWSSELNLCIMEPVLIFGTVSDVYETEDYFYIKPGTLLYLNSKSPMYFKLTIFTNLCERFPRLVGLPLISIGDIIVSKESVGKLGSQYIFGRFNAMVLNSFNPID